MFGKFENVSKQNVEEKHIMYTCSQMSFLVVLGSNGHGGHGLLYFVPHHTPNTEPSAW